MDQKTSNKSHALYRFFGRDDALLYVGITNNPSRRWVQHETDKPWWHEVARITVDPYPDRPLVLEAERLAIQAEGPKYNIRESIKGSGGTSSAAPAVESPEVTMPYLEESFDYSGFPCTAFDAALRALDDIVRRLVADGTEMERGDWFRMGGEFVRLLPYRDYCSSCRQEKRDVLAYPFAGDVRDGWLAGKYQCVYGHQWRCGWMVDIADYV